jgi:alkaline phosphatase D
MLKLRWLVALLVFVPVAPAANSPVLSRIAFGSCSSQEKPQPIWDAVVAARPDLFLFLGDNIYGDTDNMEILKQKYAEFGANPGFQKLIKACPIMATWDDHDYGTDDSGADFRARVASQKLFLDFFNEPPASPRRQREGVYVGAIFGPPGRRVQIILLDTRYFRSPLKKSGKAYAPNTDAGATMLGGAQWKWLEEQLREPAELRLIGSSIQVVAEEHPFEKWVNIPAERERLYKLLRDTKANGVVFLTGDRHLAELSSMDAGLGYPLFDLTSSGLNMGNRRWRPTEVNKHRVATMTSGDNFGMVLVDWDATPPTVRLQIRDVAGEVVIQQKIELPLLSMDARRAAAGSGTNPAAPKTPGAISPLEAAKKVGEEVTVEFHVRATGKTRDNVRVFLNSTAERQDPDNFTIVLMMKDIGDALSAAGVKDPPAYFKNKTVRVTGKVTLYQERPQIILTDAAMIGVVE